MKRILITGGTGKIGGRLVAAFARDGWKVSLTARSRARTRELIDRGLLSEREVAELDVIEADFLVPDAVARIREQFDATTWPHVLVNNARSLETLSIAADGTTSREALIGEYVIDVVVPYELSIALSRGPLESVVNVSSMYGLVPFNKHLYEDTYLESAPIQYSLAKAATLQLTRELAVRFAPRIRVNSVSYGGVEGRVPDDFKVRYGRLCPAGRMLSEDEVVGPIAYLASDASRGMTGQNLIHDGGWTAW